MAITYPRCGAEFDATLFQFGHRVRCGCGVEVSYPGVGLGDGHIAARPGPSYKITPPEKKTIRHGVPPL